MCWIKISILSGQLFAVANSVSNVEDLNFWDRDEVS